MPPVYPKRFIKWYLRPDKPQCNWRPEKVVELPQMKSWNYTCNGEQNNKGTRENLDNICLDKVFCVLKESLMIITVIVGSSFYTSVLAFAVMSMIQWTFSDSVHIMISAADRPALWGAVAPMCPCGSFVLGVQLSTSVCVCECVCEEKREEKWGKERLESKITPQTLCLCLIIKEHEHLSPQRWGHETRGSSFAGEKAPIHLHLLRVTGGPCQRCGGDLLMWYTGFAETAPWRTWH